MTKKMEKKWTGLDVYLASYLIYRGIPVELETVRERVIFVAAETDEVLRLVSAYNQNDPVGVADYASALKMVKARMYAARDLARLEAGRGSGGAR